MLQDLKTKSDIVPSEWNCCSPNFYLYFTKTEAARLRFGVGVGGGVAKTIWWRHNCSYFTGKVSMMRFPP